MNYYDNICDHDVLFLVDSNLNNLYPAVMNDNYSCNRLFRQTIDHIDDLRAIV